MGIEPLMAFDLTDQYIVEVRMGPRDARPTSVCRQARPLYPDYLC
ncbi:hypothetical protein HEB29_005445 [Streptomyces fulvorobeus]|uniref:Uncharacterized protein n=1 Tax=Streptomyces fulvorobeus TaxID=284028 RepID=A0A7Y9HH34_9ACTN|nr:hypothetical protein [Streptomyces fulvorobeus]